MNQQILAAKKFLESLGYTVTKINEEETVTHGDKFQVGDVLEYSGLYGGSYTSKITDIKGDKIYVETSWTSEDTGDTVTDKDTFSIEKDPDGNDCIIVWEYRGNYGYVYPPVRTNESIVSSLDKDVMRAVNELAPSAMAWREGHEIRHTKTDVIGEFKGYKKNPISGRYTAIITTPDEIIKYPLEDMQSDIKAGILINLSLRK